MCQSCSARLHTDSSLRAVITSYSGPPYRKAAPRSGGQQTAKATSAKTLQKAAFMSVKRAAALFFFLMKRESTSTFAQHIFGAHLNEHAVRSTISPRARSHF